MLEFPLKLVYNFNVNRNIPSINNRGNKCVNLYTCFEHYGQVANFVGENRLYCNNYGQVANFVGENRLYCNKCNGLRDADSVNILFSLCPVLVIILNRGKGKTFDCDVDFPLYLDLQNYVEYKYSISKYQLKGVISHLGESGMSGHFIAYCRHRIDNQWYLYNDSTVTLCKNQNKDFMLLLLCVKIKIRISWLEQLIYYFMKI